MKGDGRLRRNKTGVLLLLSLLLAGLCSGCGTEKTVTEETEQTEAGTGGKEAVKDINSVHLRDKETLYENDDEDSVVTMYLTVSRGNTSEHTDHSWEEINSYSAYDYEDIDGDVNQPHQPLVKQLTVDVGMEEVNHQHTGRAGGVYPVFHSIVR